MFILISGLIHILSLYTIPAVFIWLVCLETIKMLSVITPF